MTPDLFQYDVDGCCVDDDDDGGVDVRQVTRVVSALPTDLMLANLVLLVGD